MQCGIMSAIGGKADIMGQWRHCQRKILNTRGGHGTPWINLEKSREINGGEIRSRRAGKVFDFSLTMPAERDINLEAVLSKIAGGNDELDQ